jgi:N-acetylglutamate synthase-like GNAT family acetyltransferase
MKIRTIKESDHGVISDLLSQLGYPDTERFIKEKIKILLENPNEYLVVIENENEQVFGFISFILFRKLHWKEILPE